MVSKFGIRLVGCGRKCVIIDENDNIVTNKVYGNIEQAKSILRSRYFSPVIQKVTLEEVIRYYKGI